MSKPSFHSCSSVLPPPTPADIAPLAIVSTAAESVDRAPERAPSVPSPKPLLLPLGAGACPNHMLLGDCANGGDCLARHTLNADDAAAGVLPRLGPGACLTHFCAGSCANGSDCLSRHVLTEADYSGG